MLDAPDQDSKPSSDSSPASYLYERAIDALIAFLIRYMRTALLLLRRPSRAVERLLADLDSHHPRLMRPLGFMAISYLIFVIVLWRVADVGMASRLFPSMQKMVGSLGGSEVDLVQSLLVAPLPGVLFVALVSRGLSARLPDGSPRDKERVAAVLQYTVGLGLFAITLVLFALRVLYLPLEWWKDTDTAQTTWEMLRELFFTGYTLAYGMILMALAVVVPLVSTLPVHRALSRIEGLARMSWFRRAWFTLLGPLLLGSTIVALLLLIKIDDWFAPEPLSIIENQRLVEGRRVSVLSRVSATDQRPVVVDQWRAFWLDYWDVSFQCRHVGHDGTLLANWRDLSLSESETPVPATVAVEVLSGDVEADGSGWTLDPGQTVWIELAAAADHRVEDASFGLRWCYQLRYDDRQWRDGGYIDQLGEEESLW